MAVYGVSPYAMPKEVAMGCMMNLRMAQAWKALPFITSLSTALGNKGAASELRAALMGGSASGTNVSAQELIAQLKMKD